jgi:hypothetical protein
MRVLANKWFLLGFALLAMSAIPSNVRADSFTLDGLPINGFAIDSGKSFSIELPVDESFAFLADELRGTKISTITIDDYKLVGGVESLVGAHTFNGDFVDFYFIDWGWEGLQANVFLNYSSSGSTNVPEPSSLSLLLIGVIAVVGIAGFRRRKMLLN